MKLHNHQKLAIKALESLKNDDSIRAKLAFRNYSPSEMNAEYGESGNTPAEILADYETHDRQVDAAIEWVRTAR